MSSDLEKQPLLAASTSQPSLSELQQNVSRAQREYMRAWSRSTNGRVHKAIMLGTTALLTLLLIVCGALVMEDALADDLPMPRASKVALEAHIMSKCPDARDCLHDMILPAMMNVSSKVNFKLSYIGSSTKHDDGVLCKHGPQECLGNIIELCAAKLYPDPKIYLGFTMCLSKDYKDIPEQELIEDCALEHGMEFAKLNDCAVDQDGSPAVEMLQDSFKRSANAGVRTSCTVRVDGETFCIRDDGEWKDCKNGSKASDLVSAINKRYVTPELGLQDW
ncbi:hypothetical protein AMS68_004829 [Peltaster fructicola]|uniref:Gamma interferon inducible lysosomal thiol reductase GILT n=1 Tax=Peltaster fructicola TaxID=286661 RepID=A0A6H0XX09_9PEZI|nr:hypothetical protein AMS68_004829 [Peltaster fructicola]